MLKSRLSAKMKSEYQDAKQLPNSILSQQANANPSKPSQNAEDTRILVGQKRKAPSSIPSSLTESYIDDLQGTGYQTHNTTSAFDQQISEQNGVIALRRPDEENKTNTTSQSLLSSALVKKKDAANRIAKPTFHPQWKLSRVISGHLGWVRCIAVEPNNKWFATGAGDRMIKIWDLASGELKLSLTGHISTVRGLAVSSRHPYMFSCGEDKMVKCWDLETNKVIRQYHGHLSGVYCLALHPTLDVLITAGRDAVARVWDMRTKAQIHVLSGHKGTIASIICQESDPQVITGSMDATVRLWDLAAGKSISTLTHHKKSVRALTSHPQQFSFASGSSGGRNIKTWRCPEGTLMNNMTHESIVNTLSVNPDGVLFSGGDDGSMKFFDYDSGVPFQSSLDIPQPGSLDSEAGIFCSSFDQTGTRLLTGGADKTIKMYKETA
ncbi:WD40 repeat-like protein [Meira miltonrushii]|uniref:Pre-mRNA-splicing factor PRP46 n=1 Tax=Meira miltonrushii TaxID=1280837 RepID=A0A316V4C3_9BASI|nr:WD40 repeat-like protein [Meira miltonrushii]PWN32397.1 WD40 repeat-like protein [Meira miltonrushii]